MDPTNSPSPDKTSPSSISKKGSDADRLEKRLIQADRKEKETAQQFLEGSRPRITTRHRVPWDRFWSSIAHGIDGVLWRWFGGDVDVARARELSITRPGTRSRSKKSGTSEAKQQKDNDPS